MEHLVVLLWLYELTSRTRKWSGFLNGTLANGFLKAVFDLLFCIEVHQIRWGHTLRVHMGDRVFWSCCFTDCHVLELLYHRWCIVSILMDQDLKLFHIPVILFTLYWTVWSFNDHQFIHLYLEIYMFTFIYIAMLMSMGYWYLMFGVIKRSAASIEYHIFFRG